MPVSYPRAFVAFSTSVDGQQVDTGMVPNRVTVTRRTHNQADTCEVEVHGSALPFNPEAIDGVYVSVFLADGADATGAGQPVERAIRDRRFLRFVGFADKLTESRDAKGPVVKLEARDLSSMFRDWKPVPADALPRSADSLLIAIQRIMDACPTLRDASGTPRVTLSADGPNQLLSESLPARGNGSVLHVKPDATGWDVIEQAAGAVSTLVTVDGGEVKTVEPRASYGARAASDVSFVFGDETANLLSVERGRKFTRNRKGIVMTSYDPIQRRTLVSNFPSDADALALGLPNRAGGSGAPRQVEREPVAAPNGVQTQDALDALAKRVWYERSRFELEGKIVCPAWTDEVLGLRWGDRITVRVDPALEAELRNTDSDSRAIDMLVGRLAIDRDAAAALVRATKNHRFAQFLIRTVTHEFDSAGVSQSTIEFINLLNTAGAVTPP